MISVAVGVIIGAVLGLTGAGGSLFAVPLLTLLLAMPLQQSTGVALGAVAVSAWFGVWARWRNREIVWAPGLVIALGASLSVTLGRWTAARVDERWLFVAFVVLVLWVALRMWRQARQVPEATQYLRAASDPAQPARVPVCMHRPERPWHISTPCMLMAGAGGIITGWLSGVFGVGGGFVIVPLLVLLARLDMRYAVGTSLLVIGWVSSLGFISHWWLVPDSDISAVVPVAAGGIAGMMLGGWLGRRIAGPVLQQLFAIGLVVLTVAMLPRYL